MLEYLLPAAVLPMFLALAIAFLPLRERYTKLREAINQRELDKDKETELTARTLIFVAITTNPLVYVLMILILCSGAMDYAAFYDLEKVLLGIGLALGLAGAGSILGSGFIMKKVPLSAILGDSVDPPEERGYRKSTEGQEAGGGQGKDEKPAVSKPENNSLMRYVVFLGLIHFPSVLGLITGIMLIMFTGLSDIVLPYEEMTDEIRDACFEAGALVGAGGFVGATLGGFVMAMELGKEDPATGKELPLDNERFARILMKGAVMMTIAVLSFLAAFMLMSNAGVLGG